MPGTLVDTITKHKFSRAMFDEGGTPHVFMTGIITLRDATANLTSGATTVGLATVTVASTTGFRVGDYVTVSLGFPSTTTPYKILTVTATVLTLDTLATSDQTAAVVSMIDVQVLDLREEIPTVQGIVMNPSGGYVFDYDYTNRKFIVYAMKTTPAAKDPLVAVTGKALGVLTIHYIAWGY